MRHRIAGIVADHVVERLTRVTDPITGISGPGMSASFVYDGLGRREKKTINGNLTEFLYDGLNPVQETSGATILANILPGLGIDEFLTRTDVVAGVSSYFLTDALGSHAGLRAAISIWKANRLKYRFTLQAAPMK